MTTPDHPEDLVRRMLQRRAGSVVPDGLRQAVAESVGRTRQARRGPAWSAQLGTRPGRPALIAAVALVPAAAVAVLLASGLVRLAPTPSPSQPAVAAVASPSTTAASSAPDPGTSLDPTDAPTATPVIPRLPANSIAVVTPAGDGLRVRSKPSTAPASKKFTPLLEAGTRMLVVDGPVSADGYDWYEVIEEGDLFGWVASGKDGQAWIKGAEPRCGDDLDASAPWTVDRLDFLVCYGDRPVLVPAQSADAMAPDTGPEPPCRWADVAVSCTPTPRWLFEPFAVVPVGNDQRLLEVAARPAARKQLAAKPSDASMTVTLAMDDPRAPACRLVDDRDRDLVSRDEAVTRCRLRFVITDVGWGRALALPPDHV